MIRSLHLAIETSTSLGSVALGSPGALLSEVVLGVHARHSEALLPAIDFVLKNAAVDKRALAGIVVGGGPGSFTGLRISAATAKAFATALHIPLFTYSGLAALAAGAALAGRSVCALFDARRGEVYAACYQFPSLTHITTLLEPAPRKLEAVLALLDVPATVFVGDGAIQHATAIAERGGTVAPAHLAVPRAAALLWLCEIAPAVGRIDDVAGWEPAYMRESGAVRMRPR
jgi:tRNA threonylcarbamoyladenosine biosynthesis protein TsaB